MTTLKLILDYIIPSLVFVVKASNRVGGVKLDLGVGITKISVVLPAACLVPGVYGVGVGIYDRLRRSIFGATGVRWLSFELEGRSFARISLKGRWLSAMQIGGCFDD